MSCIKLRGFLWDVSRHLLCATLDTPRNWRLGVLHCVVSTGAWKSFDYIQSVLASEPCMVPHLALFT